MKKGIFFFLAGALGITTGVILACMFRIVTVEDNGMEPVFEKGQVVLAKNYIIFGAEPQKGDFVIYPNSVFSTEGEGNILLGKIAATEGARVSNIEVIPEHIFISRESMEVSPEGLYRKEDVYGEVLMRIWPFDKIGVID